MSWSIQAVGTRQAVLDYVKGLPNTPWSGSPEVNTKQYQAAIAFVVSELENLAALKPQVYAEGSNSGTPGVRVEAAGHASEFHSSCSIKVETTNVRI